MGCGREGLLRVIYSQEADYHRSRQGPVAAPFITMIGAFGRIGKVERLKRREFVFGDAGDTVN
jgi:hypothetical protein